MGKKYNNYFGTLFYFLTRFFLCGAFVRFRGFLFCFVWVLMVFIVLVLVIFLVRVEESLGSFDGLFR